MARKTDVRGGLPLLIMASDMWPFMAIAMRQASDFMAYTVGDEMAQTGSLTTSDSTLNKVIHNAIWGIKSNYKGMPVDCPQRNERQPWLGDRSARLPRQIVRLQQREAVHQVDARPDRRPTL